MYLLVAGFRYKNAPLEIRELLSFKAQDLPDALKKLLLYPSIKEAVILSTCNRTEIYTVVEDTEVASGSIIRFLADYHNLDISEIRKYMFTLMHEDTVRQIYKVTAGLDSMVLGECQITHQVKEAFAVAQDIKSIDVVLDRLFKSALSTNKKIRSQTSIGTLVTNISSAAIELVRKHLGNISDKQITIMGTGEMASLALEYLVSKYDHNHITIVNRSSSPIKAGCNNNNFPIMPIDKLKEILNTTDILFVCTAAPHYVVNKSYIPISKEITIVDIAVPRNVDPDIADLSNVRLFNIDDIQNLIDKEARMSEEMLVVAENIIVEETEKFLNWMMTLDIVPTLKMVRDRIESIRQIKLEKFKTKTCPYSQERCLIIEELSKQIVSTILHDPTVRIKCNQGHDELFQTAKLLGDLFNINDSKY